MLFNYSLSPTGQTWHPCVFFQKYEKGAEAVKFLLDTELNQFISTLCCHIDSWKWNNLQDSALLISQSSLNWNTDDEIMTQHSLKISVSYFCADKNDLIMRVCLCYYLFIYLFALFYWYFWLWDQTLLSVKTSTPHSLHPTTSCQVHQGMPKFNSGLSFTSMRGHQTNVCRLDLKHHHSCQICRNDYAVHNPDRWSGIVTLCKAVCMFTI